MFVHVAFAILLSQGHSQVAPAKPQATLLGAWEVDLGKHPKDSALAIWRGNTLVFKKDGVFKIYGRMDAEGHFAVDKDRIKLNFSQLFGQEVELPKKNSNLPLSNRLLGAMVQGNIDVRILDNGRTLQTQAGHVDSRAVWHRKKPLSVDELTRIEDKGAGSDEESIGMYTFAYDQLSEMGADAIPAYVRILRVSKNPGSRWFAAWHLGEFKSPLAVDGLLSVMSPKSKRLNSAVVRSLGKQGDPRAVQPLIDLNAAGGAPNFMVIQALGDIGDRSALPFLMRKLEASRTAKANTTESPQSVRSDIAKAFGQIGDPSVLPTLRLMASEKDAGVLASVALAFLKLEPESNEGQNMAPELISMLHDAEWLHRMALIDALAQLGSKQAVWPIVGLLTDAEPMVRRDAVKALGTLKAKEAAANVRLLLKDDDQDVRRAARETLKQLGEL